MKVEIGLSATHFFVGGEFTRSEVGVPCVCGCGQVQRVELKLVEICPLPFVVIAINGRPKEVSRDGE